MPVVTQETTDARIIRIVIDRSERANAIDLEVMAGIASAVRTAEDHASVRVAILSGQGSGFSAGHDFAWSAETHPGRGVPVEVDYERLLAAGKHALALWDSDLAILAQVHGYCLGGAMDLVLMCDLVVASHGTRFGLPASGSLPGVPSEFLYPYLVGPHRTKELLWIRHQELSAERAVEWGLVNEVVPPDDLDAAAFDWARRVADVPELGVRLVKRHVRRAMERNGARASLTDGAEANAFAHASTVSRSWWEEHPHGR